MIEYRSKIVACWRRVFLMAALCAGLGCESQPTATNDASTAKNDPRSPRIKKRDALHPEKTSKNTLPNRGR
jgi:hypothetical protein